MSTAEFTDFKVSEKQDGLLITSNFGVQFWIKDTGHEVIVTGGCAETVNSITVMDKPALSIKNMIKGL